MSDFQSEQKKRKKIRTRRQLSRKKLFLLFSVIVLGYLVFFFGSLHYRNFVVMELRLRDANRKFEQKQERIKDLEKQKLKLQDPAYVKELARKELYYMGKNEVHIKITPDPTETKQGDRKSGKPLKQGESEGNE